MSQRAFNPPPTRRQWADHTILLVDFLVPELAAQYDLDANFRGDVKTDKYKSNILASAMHDQNVAASDWHQSLRRTAAGSQIWESLDGRQRTEALIQFVQNKFKYIYDPLLANRWLEQYNGLFYRDMPEDARTRVQQIGVRMRKLEGTALTPREKTVYFLSRQQTSVTRPGERLSAMSTLNWSAAMHKQLCPVLEQFNIRLPRQKRQEDMLSFLRIARYALALPQELSDLGQNADKWVAGGKEETQLVEWLDQHDVPSDRITNATGAVRDALITVSHCSTYILRPDGRAYPPTDKKLHFLCSRIIRSPQRNDILCALPRHAFTIPEGSFQKSNGGEFKNGTKILDLLDAHIARVLM